MRVAVDISNTYVKNQKGLETFFDMEILGRN
jgi:hypothetical protein